MRVMILGECFLNVGHNALVCFGCLVVFGLIALCMRDLKFKP